VDEHKSGFGRTVRLLIALMSILLLWLHHTLNVFVYSCLPSAKAWVPSSTDIVPESGKSWRYWRCLSAEQ